MAWKVFFSTFILIFLAELGDKTQLTALASSAGSKSPWSVFFGASLALVCSTLLAVLLGMILNRQNVVPLGMIKGIAAVMFLIFGVFLLREAIFGAKEEAVPTPTPAPAAVPSFLGRAALEAALEFELAVLDEYRARSQDLTQPAARALFARLVAEEEDHIRRLEALHRAHPEAAPAPPAETPLPELPAAALSPAADAELRTLLDGFITHEETIAAFFDELARQLPLPALRGPLRELAAEERQHAAQLRQQLPAAS